HPVALVRGEIRCAHRRVVLAGVGLDSFGDRAAIERLAARLRDSFQDVGMALPGEALSWPRRAPVRHEGLGEPGLVPELGDLLIPLPGDGRRDEEAIPAIPDCALEQLLEGQLAEPGMELGPCRYATRHADAVPAAYRHRLVAGEEIGAPGRG